MVSGKTKRAHCAFACSGIIPNSAEYTIGCVMVSRRVHTVYVCKTYKQTVTRLC